MEETGHEKVANQRVSEGHLCYEEEKAWRCEAGDAGGGLTLSQGEELYK